MRVVDRTGSHPLKQVGVHGLDLPGCEFPQRDASDLRDDARPHCHLVPFIGAVADRGLDHVLQPVGEIGGGGPPGSATGIDALLVVVLDLDQLLLDLAPGLPVNRAVPLFAAGEPEGAPALPPPVATLADQPSPLPRRAMPTSLSSLPPS